MKARTILIGVFFLLAAIIQVPLIAQEVAEHSLFDEEPAVFSPPHFSLTMGSSFGRVPKGGNMFTHSVAPHVLWGPGKNFHLEVGTVFSSTQLSGFQPLVSQGSLSDGARHMQPFGEGSLTSATIYAAGTYRVNPRFSLTGATWMERTQYDMAEHALAPDALQYNPRGMMVGFDYRVTENFRFGAEVRFSSGHDPFSPFATQRSPFGGTFYPAPFNQYRRW